jgi:serine/threonine protein kinase
MGNRFSEEFQNLEPIGEGGMGRVYKATQSIGDRHRNVAIKVLGPQYQQKESYLARFDKEAGIMAGLNHPGIIQVYTAGKDNDVPYIVMEYFGGTNLDILLKKKGRFSQTETLKIGIKIAEALGHAHDRKIIHRDLHPGNIMIMEESGDVKVADLGVATVMDQERREGTRILGIPHYTSPERTQGQSVDGRADLYSLGMILYEMVTGHCYFKPGMSDSQIMVQLINKKEFSCAYPAGVAHSLLQALIRDLIKKDPNDRVPNAETLIKRMNCLHGLDAPPSKANPIPYIVGVGAIILLMGGMGGYFYSNRNAPATRDEIRPAFAPPQPLSKSMEATPARKDEEVTPSLSLVPPMPTDVEVRRVNKEVITSPSFPPTPNLIEPKKKEPPQEPLIVEPSDPADLEKANADAIKGHLAQLKAHYENHNLDLLVRDTVLSEKKGQFLNELFRHYATIEVSISDPLFTEQNQSALAVLTISRLVDKEGNQVVPGERWKQTTLEIRRVEDQWKIFW